MKKTKENKIKLIAKIKRQEKKVNSFVPDKEKIIIPGTREWLYNYDYMLYSNEWVHLKKKPKFVVNAGFLTSDKEYSFIEEITNLKTGETLFYFDNGEIRNRNDEIVGYWNRICYNSLFNKLFNRYLVLKEWSSIHSLNDW